MAATHKKRWHGQQKAITVSVTYKKQIDHFATNKVNLQQVSKRTGYKKSILEIQNL